MVRWCRIVAVVAAGWMSVGLLAGCVASGPNTVNQQMDQPCTQPQEPLQQVITRFETEPMTRIVAVGSSNTAKGYHCEGQYNWLDWLDVAVSQWWGRKHQTINAGFSGQTCRQCLDRFDRDVALHKPHVVIVSVGGNDCHPAKNISPEQFRRDLTEMVERIQGIGAIAVLQTYYSFDIERMTGKEAGRAQYFPQYMQIVREVAAETGAGLIDHLPRWERLRKTDPELYRECMRDTLHLSPLGHQVMGLDVSRAFGSGLVKNLAKATARGAEIQALLDRLETQEHDGTTE